MVYVDDDGKTYAIYRTAILAKGEQVNNGDREFDTNESITAAEFWDTLGLIWWCCFLGPFGPGVYRIIKSIRSGDSWTKALVDETMRTSGDIEKVIIAWQTFWTNIAENGGWTEVLTAYRNLWNNVKFTLVGWFGRDYIYDIPYEVEEDKNAPGYHFYDADVVDVFINLWNYFTEFLGMVNKVIKLPSGVGLFNVSSHIDVAVDGWRITKYKSRPINGVWSDWKDLTGGKWNGTLLQIKRNETVVFEGKTYEIYRCLGFGPWSCIHEHPECTVCDVAFPNSQKWWFSAGLNEVGVEQFKQGDDVYWKTHGYPDDGVNFPRKYWFWKNGVLVDSRMLWIILLVMKLVKSLGGAGSRIMDTIWSKTMWGELDSSNAAALNTESVVQQLDEKLSIEDLPVDESGIETKEFKLFRDIYDKLMKSHGVGW